MAKDEKKASKIIHHIDGLDFGNHDNYPQMMDASSKKVIAMKDVLKNIK